MCSQSDMFQSLWFSDEVNVDYGKLLKSTAVEGLRVEDLVKQYFEATEQVLFTRTHINSCNLPGKHSAYFLLSFVCMHIFTDSSAVPSNRAGHGESHSGVCRQRWERCHWGTNHLPVREDTAPPPGQRSNHRAGYRHRGKGTGVLRGNWCHSLRLRVSGATFSDPAIQRLQKEYNRRREWNQRSK